MTVKRYTHPELGKISLYKRRGIRSIKLSVSYEGEIRVSIPTWVPFKMGLAFINSNIAWLEKQGMSKSKPMRDNDRIGKAHVLKYVTNPEIQEIKIKIINNEIIVQTPLSEKLESDQVQMIVKKYSMKALRIEAERLLPQRLDILAKSHNFRYRTVKIKHLKSRWGSCNSLGDITLNFYLMQLPWELIDYVLLHELTHTKVLAHGTKFWDEFKRVLPEVKKYRKEILKYKPTVINTNIINTP